MTGLSIVTVFVQHTLTKFDTGGTGEHRRQSESWASFGECC